MNFNRGYQKALVCKRRDKSFPFTVLIFLISLNFLFSFNNLFSQESTIAGYTGIWTDNAAWSDNTSPGTTGISSNVIINGNISHIGDISFANNYNLSVNDTLIIYGNLSFTNMSNVIIGSGGLLIVRGDFYAGNMVDMEAGGYFIVTGEFVQSGADNQGSFNINGGKVFILDTNPQIKQGTGYTDLQCTDTTNYPDDCGFGQLEALENDSVFEFFSTGSYSIIPDGPTIFCAGDSVGLSVTDDGSYYQWLLDDSPIAGANSAYYTASVDGSYGLLMKVGTDTLDLDTLNVTVKSVSIAPTSATADRNNLCPGDGNIVLSYTGGTLGDGAMAQWYSDGSFTSFIGSDNNLSISTPVDTTTYYVRFEGDCGTTSAVSHTEIILPPTLVPTISLNTIPAIPEGTPTVDLDYSGVTENPVSYSIDWNPASISAGFTNIAVAPLPVSPILIDVPVGATAGNTYTGSLIVQNSCNTSTSYPISISILNSILGVNPYPTLAFSLRKLSETYSGFAVQVRRSSDNSIQDIGFTADGDLDTASLLTFAGASNVYVSKWYDQSGNMRNAVQGNNAYQPMIVSSGVMMNVNGRPMLHFDGTDDKLTFSDPPANNFSVITLARTSLTHEIDVESNSGTVGTSGQNYLFGASHGGAIAGQGLSVGTNGISNYEHGAGYMPATAVFSESVTGLNQIGIIYTSRRPKIYKNGLLVRTGLLSARATVTATTQLGSGLYGAFNGEVPELIIFPSSLTNADRQTIEFDQSCYYYIANLIPGDVSGIYDTSTTASLPYLEGTNQIWTYSIAWAADALASGFSNITDNALPASPVTIDLPAGISEGDVYLGTFSAVNSCGGSIPDHPITIHVLNRIMGNDIYASLAYSNRKIAPAYNGPALQLRRTGDGELRDVYFDSGETVSLNSPVSDAGGGNPTALTLSGWIGAGSATVRIWYDQSGNDRNATQANAASQPLLVINGEINTINTRPMIKFDGVNDVLSFSHSAENNFSIFTLAQTTIAHEIDPQSTSGTGGVNNQKYLMGPENKGNDAGQGISFGTNGISNYEHGNSYMPATAVYSGTITDLSLVDVLYANRRPYIYLNGNLVRTGLDSPKSTVYSSYQLGGMNYGYFSGSIPELIIFPKTVSSTERQQIECSQIEFYSIFGPTSAAVDTNNICPGENITLSYSGGVLRTGATAEWYSDSLLTINIGSGNNLTIPAPPTNTEYFVRFEGVCNNSLAVGTSVTVKEIPVVPDSAMVDRSLICSADGTIILSYNGGTSGENGVARWYSDSTFTNFVGTGNNLSIASPSVTTRYYMRFESDCDTTSSVSIEVVVLPLPVIEFIGLDSVYDISDSPSILVGNPFGGTYTGFGISGTNYDPALAGVRIDTVVYAYSDVNGCSNTDTMITDIRDYDFLAGARLIPSIDNWCSIDAAYTTINATADENKAGCWIDGPNFNRWFKFQATGNQIKVEVKTGGEIGTMRRPYVALWDQSGNELSCQVYYTDYADLIMGNVNLTPGDWYYISVDNLNNTNYRGSFTLCVDDSVDYDFKEGATIIPHFNDWCSADEEYSTLQASADGTAGDCWPNGPNYNRWFKFMATSNHLTVDAKTGANEGNARRLMVTLYDEADTQLACSRYTADYDDVRFGYADLIPGNWYYLTVDNYDRTYYRGTFSLCIDNEVTYDFKEGAVELTDLNDWCSPDAEYTTVDGTPDGVRPSNWNSGPNYNRWFKFRATSDQIRVEMKTGGDEGTLRNPLLALWDSSGNEISSVRYISEYSDIVVSSTSLIPGELYYISADNYVSTWRQGTFSLCVTDTVGYDYKEGAIHLPSIDNYCSLNAEYTTIGATPDGDKASTWPNGPNFNRWFKFTASSNQLKVTLKSGGEYGTLRYGLIAVWDTGNNEMSSARYITDYGDLISTTNSLIPGETYFITIDNSNNTGYRGTFSLCVDDTLDYDFREAAIEFTDLNDWCSADAAYTTILATSDGNIASIWPNGPNFNRWFKFRATKSIVKIDMKTGGDEGTLRYPLLALWDSSGNEIASSRYVDDYTDISVSTNILVPGDWYFISADNNNNTGHRGTFSMCITDTIDYDFKEAAIEISDIDNWCSANAIYTTIGATPDRVKAFLWPNGPNFNRWFKFTATSNMVKVTAKTGGVEGTLRYPMVAIFDENDIEMAGMRYSTDYDDVSINCDSLTPGDTYYIAVDNLLNTGNRGTFSLCVDDTVDYDYKAGAIELTDFDDWCSPLKAYTTIDATPDEDKGTLWANGPNYNRWFRFTASSNMIYVAVKTGGDEGTLRYPMVAIWDEAGNELNSQRYVDDYTDINVASDLLIPGNTYFISVDNLNNLGNRGSFSLCVSDTVDYDFRSAAYEITDYNDWCSNLKEFTTIGASADESASSCLTGSPYFNRWFKFRATSTDFTAKVLTGGTEGSLRYPLLTLWDSAGNELACKRYYDDYSDIELTTGTFDLVPGDLYYISVDNSNSLWARGTFSLCTDDELSYDYKDGAKLISNIDNWCSELTEFETINGTSDESRPSCWPNGPNFNRWFKFQATTGSISVQLRTAGIEGSLDRGMLALWDETLNEVACEVYVADKSDVELFSTSLTPGGWYYISVDNYNNNGYKGTFTLCVTNNIINDNKSGAILLSDLNSWCSERAKYTNSIATADEDAGSCWNPGDNKNVWFKFVATSSLVTVSVSTGTDLGSIVNPQLALWDDAGNEIECLPPDANSDTLTLVSNSLTVGDVYYISVDDDGSSGTFKICIDDDVSYDYPQGALELTDITNWCSPDEGFSNAATTLDPTGGTCWTGSENQVVWFKFKALTTDIKVDVKTGGAYGNMQKQQVGLWNIDGDEVACASWIYNQGIVTLQSDTLTPGNWYWIGVDDDRVSGTFTLCIDNNLDYDFFKNAVTIANIRAWCSADAEYNNQFATNDVAQGSCWTTGTENNNVWFKFVATTPYFIATVKTGGVYGDMQRQQLALYNESQLEIACAPWITNQGSLIVQSDTLTPGNTYYIAVADDRISQTFTICTDDRPDYDFKAGAYEITDVSNWCSANEAFSNYYATPDESMASCWSGTENKNVWFKFQATSKFIQIDLNTGNVYGDMIRPQMALWNEAGAEVACVGPIVYQGTLSLSIDSLTIGSWYYLSVDDNQRNEDFTLCFDDQPSYDYMEGALEIAHDAGCSAEEEYSNYFATADQVQGSCWSGTENENVWFKFQAVSEFLTLKLKTGTVYGDMIKGQMALWKADGTEIKCIDDINYTGTTVLSYNNLVVNDWYYVSVDDNNRSGSFTLCIFDELDYDYWDGAIILDHNSACSANEAYTNLYATADESMADCWSGTENKNVWFKFKATSPYVTASLKTGNIYGDLLRGQMALWNSSKQQIKCVGPVNYTGTTILSLDTLTVGEWYWISVDDNQRSGKFTLCLEDQLDYDYRAGAEIIPQASWCSAEAAYTNNYATADESQGSCWSGTENENLWFKFKATSSLATVSLKTGNVFGAMRYGQMAMWNEAGNEIKCVGAVLNQGTTTMSIDSLTLGNWYYISVDDNNTSGTFTLCMDDTVDYDYKAGSELIDHNGGCYPYAAYNNIFATSDRSQGSCWTGADNKNVWFKFQATGAEVKVEIKTAGVYGTMQKQQVAIWSEDDTEINCSKWIYNTGTIKVQSNNLIAGEWYYLSVDDDRTSGSFTLCIYDKVDYDYKEGAIELTDISNWCSADAAYDNRFSTPDGSQGTCWTGANNNNVWFKFQAQTENVTVDVKTGSVYGTMQRQQLALWDDAGSELACQSWTTYTGTVSLTYNSLVVGDWYYISVDDDRTSGTFTLCVQGFLLDADITGTDVSCNGLNDGSVTVTPQGGTGMGYSYSWTKDATPMALNTASITGLSPGNYEVTVTDDGDGTFVVRSFTVDENPALLLSLIDIENETCSGTSDGKLTANVSGGTGFGYLYTWYRNGTETGDPLNTSGLTGLNAAWYKVKVVDAGAIACSISDSIEIITAGISSVDPTGISISNNNICQGTPKILTVQGGSLGTGASWKWFTDASLTTSAGPDGIALTVDPAVNTIYWVRAEGDCNNTAAVFDTVKTGVPSTLPISAVTDRNNLCPGDGNIELSFTGGTLGDGATAQWYSDAAFTTNVGSGNNLSLITPNVTTTYYVRFEGDCNTTAAQNVTVTIKSLSTAPTLAASDRDNLCPADGNIELSYSGGILGTGAVAQWYSNATFATNVGNGNNLSIPAPTATTTYYLRFEGDCDTTTAASATVTIKDVPVAPTSVSVDRPSVCALDGDIVLTYTGGVLGTNGVARWYDDLAMTSSIGSGNNLTLAAPGTTTNYYVRIEADCDTTVSQTVTVTVNPDPSPVISGPEDVCLPGSGVFTVAALADHTYIWSISGGAISSGSGTKEIVVDYALSGSYTVDLTLTNDLTGCSGTATTHNVTVHEQPAISDIDSDNKLTRRF